MNKKKIAIVTIVSKNYGNRLQNYALQEYLKKMGLEVDTVPYRHNIKIMAKDKIKTVLSVFFSYFRHRWVWEEFNRKKISWSVLESKDDSLNDKYDYFIAGSDQIWNPLFWINSEREFLTFSEKEKRIAYAACIGIDELPEDYSKLYQQYFNGIPNISVREQKAAEIIYGLTKKRVPVVIDPTMLISKKEWKQFFSSCKLHMQNKYIVKYFLGPIANEYEKYIKERANKEGLEIIELLTEDGNAKKGIGPLEFVYLIANSEGVYVDSFHGAVFSILFEKPFLVFERPYQEGAGVMNSRLDTLLSTFGLQSRMIRDKLQLNNIDITCDFSKIEDILLNKRREASDFLKKAINMERR